MVRASYLCALSGRRRGAELRTYSICSHWQHKVLKEAGNALDGSKYSKIGVMEVMMSWFFSLYIESVMNAIIVDIYAFATEADNRLQLGCIIFPAFGSSR